MTDNEYKRVENAYRETWKQADTEKKLTGEISKKTRRNLSKLANILNREGMKR